MLICCKKNFALSSPEDHGLSFRNRTGRIKRWLEACSVIFGFQRFSARKKEFITSGLFVLRGSVVVLRLAWLPLDQEVVGSFPVISNSSFMITFRVRAHSYKRNFDAAHNHHFLTIKRKKRDAAYDYLQYWITIKGCPSITQCHSLLRPWWMGTEGHFFPFCFVT